MLDKVFKLAGIFAFFAVTLAGISIAYDILSKKLRRAPPLLSSGAQEEPFEFGKRQNDVTFSVVQSVRDGDKVFFLLKAKNDSTRPIPIHELRIEVVRESGELVDKCSAIDLNLTPRILPAASESTVKVVCDHMRFYAQYSGDAAFIVKLPSRSGGVDWVKVGGS